MATGVPAAPISPPRTATTGRDAEARAGTLLKYGSGPEGFDFTKLGSDGGELAIQNVAWDEDGSEGAGSRWACVRDNQTGLVWEVKHNGGGVHDKDHDYQWGGLTADGRDVSGARGRYRDGWNTLVSQSNSQEAVWSHRLEGTDCAGAGGPFPLWA